MKLAPAEYVLVPDTWMFPVAPVVVIPAVDVTPSVAPDRIVNVPPPEITVPGASICKVPLGTLKFTAFEIVAPEVYVCTPAPVKEILLVAVPVSVIVPPVAEKSPTTLKLVVPPPPDKFNVPPEIEKAPLIFTVQVFVPPVPPM